MDAPQNPSRIIRNFRHLSEVRDDVIAAVEEVEQCINYRVLDLPLKSEYIRYSLGPLLELYERLDTPNLDRGLIYRESWILCAIHEFAENLRDPRKVIDVISIPQNGILHVKFAGMRYTVRADQATRGRIWGIDFVPSDKNAASRLATQEFKQALDRLTSSISLVGRMCDEVDRSLIAPESIRWAADSTGVLFEQLIVDVLNEDEITARRANLFEDLFEWTDLRVKYQDLPRKHGARIQVKLGLSPESARPPRRIDTATHVIFGPWQLANFIEKVCGKASHEELIGSFWITLGSKPGNVHDLASALLTDVTR